MQWRCDTLGMCALDAYSITAFLKVHTISAAVDVIRSCRLLLFSIRIKMHTPPMGRATEYEILSSVQ